MKIKFLLLLGFIMSQLSICHSQSLPIKPARTISFMTDEGSYMDVDVSPDGKSIVFDILGDLYIVPVAGGNATQLTRGLAYRRCPVWSPDGKHIAFISDASGANRLEVMDANGSGERTLDLTQSDLIGPNYGIKIQAIPAWMSNGQYVAAGDQLYALAGGSMKLPFDIKYNVQFSKDARYIYADEDGENFEYLERYDRHSGAKTKLAAIPLSIIPFPRSGWQENQTVSPDGQWLAYVVARNPESDLRIRNIVTNKDHLLAPGIEGHHRNFLEHFSFTPDSKNVLIGFNGKLHQINVESGADHVIPFQAKVNADLGAFDYHRFRLTEDSLQVRMTHSANASPDGKTLVFSALDHIYTMRMPNGIPHLLVKQPFGQFQPVYSTDGKWIAYVSWSDTEGGHVWRVPAVGGKPEQLTALEGCYQHPAWSPDGRQLSVVRDSLPADICSDASGGVLGTLQVINVDKKTSRIHGDSIVSWRSQITFSEDGQSVNASTAKNGHDRDKTLISFSLSSKQRQILEKLDGTDLVNSGWMGLQYETISPDNHYLVYGINEDLYLVPFAGLGTPDVLNSSKGTKPIIRFACGGYDPHWEEGGKILSWSYGNHYYRVNPAKIMQMALQAAKDSSTHGLSDNGFYKLNVIPNQTITINLKAPNQYGKGTIALQNVRIISMKGNEVIEHGTIVISNGRFTLVGPTENIVIPFNAKVYDLNGKTVMPGMIDLHDHIGGQMGVFPQQYWRYMINLVYGVTTARDPANGFDQFAYSELLQTGLMIGPRLFSVGYPFGETSASMAINSIEDAVETARKRVELGAMVAKQYQQDTRLQRQWVLMGCEQAGLNMTNEGDLDPRAELAMIKDGSTGVEHAYGWGNVYSDVVHFVAASGTWHTPTLVVCTDGAERYFKNLFRQNPDNKLRRFWPATGYPSYEKLMKPESNMPDTVKSDLEYTSSIEAKIYKQGGHIGLGGHGNDPGIISQWELWALQMGGLTNLEALKVATINGAEALGMQQDLGSIEPGKVADLIILDKNPLDDIHNTMSIHYVMKSGILYDGNTLDEIWPEHKKRPEWNLDKKYLTKNKQ